MKWYGKFSVCLALFGVLCAVAAGAFWQDAAAGTKPKQKSYALVDEDLPVDDAHAASMLILQGADQEIIEEILAAWQKSGIPSKQEADARAFIERTGPATIRWELAEAMRQTCSAEEIRRMHREASAKRPDLKTSEKLYTAATTRWSSARKRLLGIWQTTAAAGSR